MSKNKRPPRSVPERDDYYMGLAFWIMAKSKDPDTQIGSVIINSSNRPLGWGYNGPPRLLPDEEVDWSRPEKYDFIKHAEANAIDHSNCDDLHDATLYVTAKPCKKCMLDIISHEIPRVIYYPLKGGAGSSLGDNTLHDRTDELAQDARIQLVQFQGNLNWMRDHIRKLEAMGIFD